MLYWYRDLMISDKLKKHSKRHIGRVERYYRALPKSRIFSDKKRVWEQWIGKKIPWKEYVVVTRSRNPMDLFDVMSVRQWIFRHYSRTDIYVVGLYTSRDEAIEALQTMLCDAFEQDPMYEPRDAFKSDDEFEEYKE